MDFQHQLTLTVQESGQPSPIAAGPLNAPGLHLTQTLSPGQQGAIAPGGGRNPGRGQVAAKLIQDAGDMNLAVGVDPDGDPARLVVCDGGDGRLPS
jgi:hypothetical protein